MLQTKETGHELESFPRLYNYTLAIARMKFQTSSTDEFFHGLCLICVATALKAPGPEQSVPFGASHQLLACQQGKKNSRKDSAGDC